MHRFFAGFRQRRNGTRRMLGPGAALLAALCAACTQARPAEPPLPGWLSEKIAHYDAAPAQHETPLEIWQIRHRGAPAYFVVSACCDRFNPLLDGNGREICSPSGGFTGAGDGKCPRPMDRGSEARLIWANPQSPETDHAPPRLGEE